MCELLFPTAQTHGFRVWAYCFMPDHLHLLVQGTMLRVSLPQFVREFKQRTSFAFRHQHRRPLWQRSYYDHVLRDDEDVLTVARYIFENPLRKGLVQEFRGYPFSGPPEILGTLA